MHHDVLPDAWMGRYGVRLLKAFEQCCAYRKVVEISLGVNSGEAFENGVQFVLLIGYGRWVRIL
jgi:hypothetical protein